MGRVCAIIAGSGSFPLHVAREAKRQGWTVVAVGLKGWADSSLAQQADVYEEVAVGQLGRLIDRLKAHQVHEAVMAGKVTKAALFDPRASFDPETLGLLARVKETSVNGVLGAIADRLSQDGITLLDSSTFLKDALCPVGALTHRSPTAQEEEDVQAGLSVARQIAQLDIGQTVVVKHKVIVAVEALEGTDAAIARAGQVAGAGCVVVKMASPRQDRRFDLPVLGPRTIEVALSAGVTCLAVEAHTTLVLDKDAALARADAANLCVVGVEPVA